MSEYTKPMPASQSYPTNYTGAQTDEELWDPAAGKKIALFGAVFSVGTAGNVFLEIGGTTTKIIPALYIPANGTVCIGSGTKPIWVGAADQTITYTSSMAGNNSVLIWGEEI